MFTDRRQRSLVLDLERLLNGAPVLLHTWLERVSDPNCAPDRHENTHCSQLGNVHHGAPDMWITAIDVSCRDIPGLWKPVSAKSHLPKPKDGVGVSLPCASRDPGSQALRHWSMLCCFLDLRTRTNDPQCRLGRSPARAAGPRHIHPSLAFAALAGRCHTESMCAALCRSPICTREISWCLVLGETRPPAVKRSTYSV